MNTIKDKNWGGERGSCVYALHVRLHYIVREISQTRFSYNTGRFPRTRRSIRNDKKILFEGNICNIIFLFLFTFYSSRRKLLLKVYFRDSARQELTKCTHYEEQCKDLRKAHRYLSRDAARTIGTLRGMRPDPPSTVGHGDKLSLSPWMLLRMNKHACLQINEKDCLCVCVCGGIERGRCSLYTPFCVNNLRPILAQNARRVSLSEEPPSRASSQRQHKTRSSQTVVLKDQEILIPHQKPPATGASMNHLA